MKKLFIIPSLLLITAASIITGCDKNEINYGETVTVTSEDALLKFNFVSVYAANPSVQLKVNGVRVSSLITARTPFPGGGFNTGGGSTPDYLTVKPGSTEISVAIPKKNTQTDSIVLFKNTIQLDAGNNYTTHITDTGANTRNILITDDFSRPDSGKARYRFINLMPNVAVDIYFGTTAVVTNLAYGSSTSVMTIQNPTVATAWNVREAGTGATGPVLATYTSASTYLNQRVYTGFAMGYKGLTDAVRKPYISFLLNR
jgi:hypothetical protein